MVHHLNKLRLKPYVLCFDTAFIRRCDVIPCPDIKLPEMDDKETAQCSTKIIAGQRDPKNTQNDPKMRFFKF